ncbi:MAG: hypothetical protein HZB42_02465 [Sphingobacteriales bacterium]|nr:hypothetical protein [Sphingobacteriales bacterium]
MKKMLVILFVYMSMTASANSGKPVMIFRALPPDTTILSQILNLPLSSYIGKPVDSLFLVLPTGYTRRGFMPTGIGYTKGVYQSYFTSEYNNCFVEIFIDTFQFLPIPNRTPTTTWDMSLAKKETIAFIKVWKNNNICIYGCNNPAYYD